MKIEILEKIEGEATLEFDIKNETIEDVYVRFTHFRGIEEILKNRPFMDALVITPRVCGICGHAHMQASAMAIEKAFDIAVTKKAKDIRDITRYCEIAQNHLKWLYFVILPFLQIKESFAPFHRLIIQTNRLSAIFSGQWPHASYAVPGGVTCDPSALEIFNAKKIIQNVKEEFFAIFGNLYSLEKLSNLSQKVYENMQNIAHIGKAYDRTITFSKDRLVKNIKILHRNRREAKIRFIKEEKQPRSYAKRVTYKGKFYETGPIARMTQLKPPLFRQLHRRYKDSVLTRVFARIIETKIVIEEIENILLSLDIDEPSYIEPHFGKKAKASVSIEAARGSLIHFIEIEEGKIALYNIITPTQWNLSNGTKENPSLIQKAISGVNDIKLANFIFRTFDICSVCTTH